MIGTVYKSTGSWYSVKTDQGKFYQCKIKGKLRLENFKSTNPVAVGDRVNFSLENNDEENLPGFGIAPWFPNTVIFNG